MSTPIPQQELQIWKLLTDVKVVVDVGARTDTDIVTIFPGAEVYMFEPNPVFYQELVEKTKQYRGVTVNNFGLGNISAEVAYNDTYQCVDISKQYWLGESRKVRIERLEDYVKNAKVTRIDFLKIDAEGCDCDVLRGAGHLIPSIKYIQAEHSDDIEEIKAVVGDNFEMIDVGFRNLLFINKLLVKNISNLIDSIKKLCTPL